jgi:hypothetical protein
MTVVCYTMLCWIQQQYIPGQVVYCHASDSCVLMRDGVEDCLERDKREVGR